MLTSSMVVIANITSKIVVIAGNKLEMAEFLSGVNGELGK